MAFPASRFAPAVPLPLRVPPQLTGAGPRQPEQDEPSPAGLPALLPRTGRRHRWWRWRPTGWCRRQATCSSAGSRSGSARPLADRKVTIWVDEISLHVLPGGARIKTLPSRLGVSSWPGWPPAAPARRSVPAAGRDRHGRGGGAHGQRRGPGRPGRRPAQRGLPAGRAAGRLADGRHPDDGHHRRRGTGADHALPGSCREPSPLRGARRAAASPPPPSGPVTVQRRVSSRGGIMVATQKIQVGLIHAGKIVTVTAGDHAFRLTVDGQPVRVVPRTTTRDPPVQGLRGAPAPGKALTGMPDVAQARCRGCGRARRVTAVP